MKYSISRLFAYFICLIFGKSLRQTSNNSVAHRITVVNRLRAGMGMPILALFGALVLSGCNDSDKTPKLDPEPVSRAVAITGAVVAGNVNNADVAVHLINSDSTIAETAVATVTTDADGGFSATIPDCPDHAPTSASHRW